MRVLVCSSEYYPYVQTGGIGRIASYVTKRLEKEDFDCDVCSPHGPDIEIQSPNFKFLPGSGFFRRVIFWLKAMGFLRHIVEQYDIVWLHNPLLFYKIPSSNFVVTIHGFVPEHYEALRSTDINALKKLNYLLASKLEAHSTKKLDNQGATFSVVCPNTRSILTKLGIAEDKIKTIPNGVDIQRFKPRKNKRDLRRKLGLPEEHVLLLFVGRMTPQKRPYLLVNFFSRVIKQNHEITLVMVGKGPLLNGLKKYVKKNNICNVMFLGYVPDSSLPIVFSSCDIFVMSSAYEGNPLALLEATASGLPSVVQDIPSLNAIVKQIGSGLVLSMEDENASSILLNYINSKRFRKDSINSRRYAEDHLDLDKMVLNYKTLFERIKKTR